jgi:hypothetical protein
MTADNGNGNGELRQLLELKRGYRRDLTSLEKELRVKFERELVDGKKRLKEQYLENVVDTVFAEPAPVKPVPEVAPAEAFVSKADVPPRCPDCDAPVDPTDKFCAECSYPLKEDVKDDAPVVSAGGKFRKRRRS